MATDNTKITFKNEPIKVGGTSLKVGDSLPNFVLTGLDLSDVTPSNFAGKNLCISVVPSIDTPICDLQTSKFNATVGQLGDNVAVLTVSMDLPFAQKRWCAARDAHAVTMASDYKYHKFGQQFGVALDSLGLLARAVFVVNGAGKITYVEYVDEVTTEPNYDAATAALKALN